MFVAYTQAGFEHTLCDLVNIGYSDLARRLVSSAADLDESGRRSLPFFNANFGIILGGRSLIFMLITTYRPALHAVDMSQ